MAAARRRWSDRDRNLGPFTLALRDSWSQTTIMLSSGEDEYPGASLRFSAFRTTLIVTVPQWLIRPHVAWHDLSNREWAKPGPDGRKGYVEFHRREYGFTLSDGHLSIHMGRQTGDSSTTQDWGCFLPWTQWRHVRRSLYGLTGALFATLPDARWGTPEHECGERLEAACPRAVFDFDDFDGERIQASTRIEERQWEFGTGWFRWLSLFRASKIHRSLDIAFSAETGERKGSWKGGTVGHAIEMQPGELHEAAFRRYCAKHKTTFIGLAATVAADTRTPDPEQQL